MDPILWQPQYRTGISAIDSQHQHLFALCESLRQALATATDKDNKKEICAPILDELINYIDYHFNYEETFFKDMPFAKEHRRKHAGFVNKILGITRRFSGTDTIDQELLGFLAGWLIVHIVETDIPDFKQSLSKNITP